MAVTFKRVTLPHTHLAQSMGKSQSEALTVLQNYLDQNAIRDFEIYTLDMVIKQGSKRNVMYLAYASLPEGFKNIGSIKVIQLKRNDFLEFEVSNDDYDAFLDGAFNDEINEYMKNHELSGDMSSVFALLQKNEHYTRVLLPYKLK